MEVICVAVDCVEYCFYVVDVVDVVVIGFMRVTEAVVPRCRKCCINDTRFLVVLFVGIEVVVVSVAGC